MNSTLVRCIHTHDAAVQRFLGPTFGPAALTSILEPWIANRSKHISVPIYKGNTSMCMPEPSSLFQRFVQLV